MKSKLTEKDISNEIEKCKNSFVYFHNKYICYGGKIELPTEYDEYLSHIKHISKNPLKFRKKYK